MNIAFITAAPFLLALLFSLPAIRQSVSQRAQTALTSIVLAGLFLSLLLYLPDLQAQGVIIERIDWIPSLGVSLSFYLDGLALIFSLIVTGVGALIFFYAGFYFDDSQAYNRFNVWLLAFAGSMLLVVLSGNLLMMFVAWELTSITSFVLIGFTGDKDRAAREGAFKALFVTGGGALALIIGFVMLSAACGQLLYPEGGVRFVTDLPSILSVESLYQHEWFPIFAALILCGGLTKSAQFPFHFWLPGAMTAPTPASAYLHSATMVKAGIFLFARLSPVMYKNALWSDLLLIFGLSTMFVGALFALKQRDLKALLAYSTVSALGAIVAMIGLPGQNGIKAALVGIVAHALYKSALFLVAGTIDHATGTRVIDRLGGLRRQMPYMFAVTIISALSMAGVPFLLGFVAKETLLDAFLHYSAPYTAMALIVVSASAILTAMAGYMLIYEVFIKRAEHDIHFHQPPRLIRAGPILLSIGSLTFGVLIEPVIVPLLQLAVPKTFELQVFAGFNQVFWLSAGILAAALLLFVYREPLIKRITFPLSGNFVYRELIAYIDWAGQNVLHTQSGFVRYYLVIILGTVAAVLIASGTLTTVTAGQSLFPTDLSVNIIDLAKIFMLLLTIAAGIYTIIVREHVKAAIAYGVIGYAGGVIFLIEHAPDVALVQLLVETMATVLIIIMLGRISTATRRRVTENLWIGRHSHNVGFLRDLTISIVIGVSVFVFSYIALQSRPERRSIAEWHLANSAQVNSEDVVGAIVADFRATDTLMEIVVFTTAALGVLTLLSRGRSVGGALTPGSASTMTDADDYSEGDDVIQAATSLSTHFTRWASKIVLPIAILIGIAQILYGSSGPGDGFTAGVTIGLAISLWYVVLGYYEAKRQLTWFRPTVITRLGLLIALINALFPILLGKGFMAHVQYDKILGIYDFVGSFGLHVTSALIFEIAIAIAVMGGLGIIIEAIAYPREVQSLDDE